MIDINKNTVEEWLAAWDRDEEVPTIEMGGLGAGYEHALQSTAFEIVRFILANKAEYDEINGLKDEDERRARWRAFSVKRDAALFAETSPLKDYGLSGAQVSAATNLASVLMQRGLSAMNDDAVKDRRITIRRTPNEQEAKEGAKRI